MLNKNQKGFTLIELMIVVAIIGVLASIALPAYQNYAAKASTTSAYSTITSGKTMLFDYYVNNGKMPTTTEFNSDQSLSEYYNLIRTGLPGNSKGWYQNLSSVRSQFFITFYDVHPQINGRGISIHFTDRDGQMMMNCHSSGIDIKYLPKQCHGPYIP